MTQSPQGHPATLTIDYPDGPRNRLTCFFRLFTAIPILVLVGLFVTGNVSWRADNGAFQAYSGTWFIVVPTVLMILFRRKYPRWWFDFNLNLTKFVMRVAAYVDLLRDEYPSTDEDQSVHVDIPYPDAARGLRRWLPLFKWIMAIPHVIVLGFLYIGAAVVTVIAWFAILFTARYPRGLWEFVVGVHRWNLRVVAYALILTTDTYPPFRLAP
jgi:hypothetical protein